MLRLHSRPRDNWQTKAAEYGFHFHTMYGQTYWDETAYYQFTLEQIEQDLEQPSEELHQMCLAAVDKVSQDDYWLQRFQIPETFWQPIADSWQQQEPSLYSRLDLVYQGKGPAKLLENNADTPTSLYESGFWQWLWLEDLVNSGQINARADQFNSLQEKLVNRFRELKQQHNWSRMHFSCCQDTEEDRGTVQYLQDCATEADIGNEFVFIEDIGLSQQGFFTDITDAPIDAMFKLYPWEFMQREDFGQYIQGAEVKWLEPLWKSILSNKALLPLLWQMFPNHPNLLPAWFEDELSKADSHSLVKKPIFSREGANISILQQGQVLHQADGPYGEEGFIYQAYEPLPVFDNNYTLIGSWLVDDQAAGISVREDTSPITQDLSRYLPHIIL